MKYFFLLIISKKLLFFCILFVSVFPIFIFIIEAEDYKSNSYKCYYIGTIGKNDIQMELIFNETKITGYYFYESDGRHIKLTGNKPFHLQETFEDKKTGSFSGNIKPNTNLFELKNINGQWNNPKGTIKIPFSISKIADYIKLESNESSKNGGSYKVFFSYPKFLKNYYILNQGMKEVDNKFRKTVEEFKEYMEDNKYSLDSQWDYRIIYYSKNIICFSVYNYSDLGGVHPGDWLYSLVFQVTSSTLIPVTKMDDFFKSNFEEKLEKLCKYYLMKNYDELTEDSYRDWISCTMPIIHRNGIEFISPSSRRGALGAGMFNILIPYTALKEIIRKDGPLKEFLVH